MAAKYETFDFSNSHDSGPLSSGHYHHEISVSFSPALIGQSSKSLVGVSISDAPSWRRKINIGSMLLTTFGFGAAYSILAPFFPQEGAMKGLSSTTIGLIFGIFELIVFLMSPIYGYLTPMLGAQFMLFFGMTLAGCSTVLFGVLAWCPAGVVFGVLAFVCRSVEAIGVAMYLTAAFAVAASLYPNDVPFVYSMLEAMNGIGLVIGPAIGGWLYAVGGFQLPFFVLGGLLIGLGVVTSSCLTTVDIPRSDLKSPLPMFRVPRVSVVCFANICSAVCYNFIPPVLSLHLNDLGLTDPTLIGLVFVSTSFAYGVASVVLGKLVGIYRKPVVWMMVSAILQGFVYQLLGPAPWFGDWVGDTWSVVITYSFLGLFFPMMLLPIPDLLSEAAEEAGLDPDALSTQGTIAGIYQGIWFFGAFLGPTISGPMIDAFGFRLSMSILGYSSWAYGVIIIFYWIFYERRR